MKTLKEYCLDTYEIDEMKEIVRQGMSSGCANLIYYHETSLFYEEYKDEIWSLLSDLADEIGEEVVPMFASWPCMKSAFTHYSFVNGLVWAAIEETCSKILTESDIEGRC